jgi:putative redox protein
MSQLLRVQIDQAGASTAAAEARSHRVFVDRPTAKGGADRGPLGGEYLLIGLGGCFMSNLLAAIRAREAAVSSVRIAVTGTMEGSPERFTAFTMDVAATHNDSELVRKLIGIAARACAVTNTLKRSASMSVVFESAPVNIGE